MTGTTPTTRAGLKTPKAAAIAGIVFAVLLIVIFTLFRSAVPGSPTESGEWLAHDWRKAALCLNLIPFAGVAFLWFIGVLRDRLGAKEDRFFATVFFGSALLFMAMLFVAASLVGALIIIGSSAKATALIDSQTFHFARAASYILVNIYAAVTFASRPPLAHPGTPVRIGNARIGVAKRVPIIQARAWLLKRGLERVAGDLAAILGFLLSKLRQPCADRSYSSPVGTFFFSLSSVMPDAAAMVSIRVAKSFSR